MGYLDANDRPGEYPASWYAETSGPLTERASLRGEIRTDVCVVGGGYAGLSAALHLARRGYEVVLLEAHRAGWGASGRNGGQIGVGPRADIGTYEKLVGREDALKVWDLCLEATALVRTLIERHDIDCQLVSGGMEAAWKRKHARELAEHAEHLARYYDYERLEVLSAADMAERLGTRRYRGGVLVHEGGHLHPLRYALGLAEAAEFAGARLYERSRVIAVRPGLVETEAGSVRAGHIVLAMNGYIDGLVPQVTRRAMPINNFIVTTEPLGEERARAIIRDNVCVADSKFVLDYYRLTPDHRLLWGGGESYGQRFPRDIRRVVRPKMLAVYPQLRDVKLTHAWGGTLAITGTRFPVFQELGGGMLSISGWSGSGIHMATFGGALAAEAVAGRAERWDVLARMPSPPFPGGDWFRLPLLWAAMTMYRLRDRL